MLTTDEVRRVLQQMRDVPRLVASLLYGAGLRLQECLELRVKDVDFERREITIRRGKGQKDRRVMLPESVRDTLHRHLEDVQRLHHRDLAAGHGRVVLPDALAVKFPNAVAEWRWQFVFPAGRLCRDARYGTPSRYHPHESVIQRAVTEAARRAGLRGTLFHEFHHLVRGTVVSDLSLLGRAVMEGMATAFERDFAGMEAPWGVYPSEVEEWVAELLALPADAPHDGWMSRHPDGRRWVGFKVGTYLIDQAGAVSGRTPADLVLVSTDDVLRLAGWP